METSRSRSVVRTAGEASAAVLTMPVRLDPEAVRTAPVEVQAVGSAWEQGGWHAQRCGEDARDVTAPVAFGRLAGRVRQGGVRVAVQQEPDDVHASGERGAHQGRQVVFVGEVDVDAVIEVPPHGEQASVPGGNAEGAGASTQAGMNDLPAITRTQRTPLMVVQST